MESPRVEYFYPQHKLQKASDERVSHPRANPYRHVVDELVQVDRARMVRVVLHHDMSYLRVAVSQAQLLMIK